MTIARVEPLGIALEMNAGETVMQAAERAGYYWPTVCGGVAECGACLCEVRDGGERADVPTERELRVLKEIGAEGGQSRLACCLEAKGSITVFKEGVRAW